MQNPLVGTGGFEPPTPTVSKIRASLRGSRSLTGNAVCTGSSVVNPATTEDLIVHGVHFKDLASYVLDHPDDSDAVVALAAWLVGIAPRENP